jgi:hypothetical protein
VSGIIHGLGICRQALKKKRFCVFDEGLKCHRPNPRRVPTNCSTCLTTLFIS